MKIEVEGCYNCPFINSDYDDFAVGSSTIESCNLSEFLNQNEYFIAAHNSLGTEIKTTTPDWCPLKKENVNIHFSNLDISKKERIEYLQTEIRKLENFDDDDLPDIDKLDELNDELCKLINPKINN